MKTVIVGGVAGGATTAARLRRRDESAEIIMIERGSHISYANCGLPYYIGGTISERDRLFVQTPESFNRRLGVEVRIESEAVEIDRKAAHSSGLRAERSSPPIWSFFPSGSNRKPPSEMQSSS